MTCQLKSKSLITHLSATNPERRIGATITVSSHQGASARPFLAGISGMLSSASPGSKQQYRQSPPSTSSRWTTRNLFPGQSAETSHHFQERLSLHPEKETISSDLLFCRPAIIDLSAPALRFYVSITYKAYR